MTSRRIVYVWDADYPWDVRAEKTCLALTQAGHDVHLVARNRKWSPRVERLPEATVHRMVPWRWAGRALDGALGFPAFFNPRWRGLVGETVRAVGADVIIARDLPLCPTAIAVGRRAGIPVVLDMAEHYPAIMRELWTSKRHRPLDYLVRNPRAVERVERYCVQHVDHILTTAEEASERLETLGVPAVRMSVVRNTPSRDRVAPLRPVRASAPGKLIDVVYLGLLEVSRGIMELLDACAMLRDTPFATRLVIIGSGRDEALFHDHARRLGLTERHVVFHGHVPYATAMQMVGDADIGALPIHVNEHMNTTIPNKLFDYMSVGIPVITSNSVPSARVVHDVGCGEVVPDKNAPAVAEAIRRLGDPEDRARRGEAGRRAILEQYNWENDTKTLVNII